MTAPLTDIRRQLASLRRARRRRRWCCGSSILVTTLLWTLLAVFVIDVLFELDTIQRLTVMLIGSATLLWAIYRYALPFFGVRETEVDLALLTQRHHHIDTDLVAAIEFTSPEAASWGSVALREAVIQDMVARGRHLDMSRAVDRYEPMRKLELLALTAAVVGCGIVLAPAHFSIFLQRLCLGHEHYPSRTVISHIELNHMTVLGPGDGATPHLARCAERGPVEFRVHCAHHPPTAGELLIWPADGGDQRRVPLARSPTERTNTESASDTVLFVGRLPLLLDSLQYQVYLGDAWTNPATINMIALPQVELRMAIQPPRYSGSLPADIP